MSLSHQHPAEAPIPLRDGVLRWGERGLWAALGLGLALTLVAAWQWSELAVFFPLVPLAPLGIWWLFRRPLLNLVVVLGAYAFIITPEEGIQLEEVVYGLYYLSFLAHWYTRRLVLERRPLVESREDRLVLLILLLCVFGGALLGLLMGAPPGSVRGEAMSLGMFAFYFPIKEACLRYERAPRLLLGVVVWMAVFVTLRNFLQLEQIIRAATEAWHISDKRFGINETHLVVAALGVLLLAVVRRGWRRRAGLLALFLLLSTGLVITKSRAYWVAFLLGGFLLLVFLDGVGRGRLLAFATLGSAGILAAMVAVFGPTSLLLMDGIVRRFSTLEAAATQDLSLINRFVETGAVLQRVVENPVLGYGLGSEYSYHSLIYEGHFVRSYIHNGFAWLWHKLGLWGLVLILVFYGRAIWCGLRAYRRAPSGYGVYGLWASVSLLALAPTFYTSNGFPLPDIMLVHAILVSVACGLWARSEAEAGVGAGVR